VNLVSNAIKFTPRNGSIELACHADAELVYVSVKDSGIGIPTEKLGAISSRSCKSSGALRRRMKEQRWACRSAGISLEQWAAISWFKVSPARVCSSSCRFPARLSPPRWSEPDTSCQAGDVCRARNPSGHQGAGTLESLSAMRFTEPDRLGCGRWAPVAQLDRAADFGSAGWRFEPFQARSFA
jgi:hypothetical protein